MQLRKSISIHAVAGLILVSLSLWGFAILADEVPEQGWMVRADTALANGVHASQTIDGQHVFSIVTLLGREVLVMAILAATLVFLRRRDWLRAWALVLTTVTGAVIEGILKQLFHRGRPEYAWVVLSHHSWSFPSGHAMNSLIGYGALLYFLLERRPPRSVRIALIASTAIVLIVIGLSRVYLGVHYASDVVAGWLGGMVWLAVCAAAYRMAREEHRGAPRRRLA
jgi:membrane-associated phospholipid phosphatase